MVKLPITLESNSLDRISYDISKLDLVKRFIDPQPDGFLFNKLRELYQTVFVDISLLGS